MGLAFAHQAKQEISEIQDVHDQKTKDLVPLYMIFDSKKQDTQQTYNKYAA
jgi:hypothetical protein